MFVYGSSDINILHIPFFRSGKDPLEDLIYTSCIDPIQQPAAARTPRVYTSPRLCQSLFLRLFHSRITVLCSTVDSADVKVADPPVVSTADPDFLLLQLLTAESFSSVHSRITVLCSTADSTDVKVADPPVVSTADPDFLLLQLLVLLSSTTDQTSNFRMRPLLFPPKRSNEQDSLLSINHKDITLLFVYGSSDINILHLPFFRSWKDPLEDFIYTSCTDPIQQPTASRTPKLYTSPRLCQSLVLRLWIQLAMGPQPLWLRNHNFGLAQRIMVKRLATSPHDPLGITDSACKNQLVVVSIQYGPFNAYIPIRSTAIGKSRVVRDPIAMHIFWRSNSDIASVTRVSMTFRVVRTNQYNQDLQLFHSTNGNHLESPNEGSSIDHQVTIHLHAQNITMFPTNEKWYFASQVLVSISGGLILILTAQSTRNEFRIHSDY
ncbi:kinesin-related protein [Dorcoceras hygrometricum]|uniref:Kinesin-related protein n=1 Tax=Dorcoceras hygrometricum TaxID=472368 RepID=A0A2Z7B3F0_9LAMI|nr:kinesin-related protein [Dorcoceras hygrometricum]